MFNDTYQDLAEFARPLSFLQRDGVLTPENQDVLANHANPLNLALTLSFLQRGGILTLENRAAVTNHVNSLDLASAISSLQRAEILTQENFTVVANHVNPGALASALSRLHQDGIFTQENFAIVAIPAFPDELASALSYLHHARNLTPETRMVVATHAHPYELAVALSLLRPANILTPDNQIVVINHVHPSHLAFVISDLHYSGILTQENFDVVANHANLSHLALALSDLHHSGILTQESFDALLHPVHASLLTDEARERVWHRIPLDLLTQVNFIRLLIAAEHPNPIQEIGRVTAQIIGVGAVIAQNFNDAQSTHTASVHRSVSISADKLMDNYGRSTNLETKICEIRTYVNGLESSLKHDAAKRCIARITAPDYYFTDSLADVSTRQLLALAFRAIHDDTKRQGMLEDAKARFIDALYEIQRGYNINEQGIDDGQPDRSICTAGTFNKIMEKLNGIHTDVEIYYITPQGANFKFPKLAEVHALQYLRSIAFPNTPKDFQQSKAIIDRIQQNDSLEPIWDNIKDSVARDLWDEFKLAYGDNPEHTDYLYLTNHAWQDLVAPKELPEIEAQLLASDGYQQSMALHVHGLWANRHASPATQNDFDKQYGLAIIPNP